MWGSDIPMNYLHSLTSNANPQEPLMLNNAKFHKSYPNKLKHLNRKMGAILWNKEEPGFTSPVKTRNASGEASAKSHGAGPLIIVSFVITGVLHSISSTGIDLKLSVYATRLADFIMLGKLAYGLQMRNT